MVATISTHNGSTAHREHNLRNKRVVEKEKHIKKDGHYEIWKDESPKQAYHRLFDKAVEDYNRKQTRADRKIENYYAQIAKDDKKHPVYEMIVGVYPKDQNPPVKQEMGEGVQRAILKEFVDTWSGRNPNLELIGAYYHADEEGEPHVHIDYVPVAHGYTKGMETQTGLVKALGEQGFEKTGHLTAQMKWQKSENQFLENLCKDRGIEIHHPMKDGAEHIATDLYKAEKALEASINHTRELSLAQEELRAETKRLEDERNLAERLAQKGLERKERAFSKSWKKHKETGYSYDKGLEKEIRDIVKERAEDVKAISHTDLDVQRAYNKAKATILQAQAEAGKLLEKRKAELEQAEKLRLNLEVNIHLEAERLARSKFDKFLKETGQTTDKAQRLEEYCRSVCYKDGGTVLDGFIEQEKKRIEKLNHSWER